MSKKRILVAPLDWGLGHATRCVPLIRSLLAQDAVVVLGASAKPLAFLRGEFPDLEWIEIPSPVITYQDSGSFILHLLRQMPGILAAVKVEHQWLLSHTANLRLDGVISDNRYGLWHPSLPSVLMTHQLFPVSPWYGQWLVNRQVRTWCKPFLQIWVPDVEGAENLSGRLSHGHSDGRVNFIGPLSRFPVGEPVIREARYEYLGLVSGPEPQRTHFQKLLVDVFNKTGKRSAVVCGLPDFSLSMTEGVVDVIPHLPTNEFLDIVGNSKNIICRSGYSTIMDLVHLKRTALLVPTPGQTEQEYLGRYLSDKGYFSYTAQKNLSTGKLTVDQVSPLPAPEKEKLNRVVQEFLQFIPS